MRTRSDVWGDVLEAGWQGASRDDEEEVDGGLAVGMGRKVAATGCKGALKAPRRPLSVGHVIPGVLNRPYS